MKKHAILNIWRLSVISNLYNYFIVNSPTKNKIVTNG